MYFFPLTANQVIEVTVTYIKMDQLVVNRFDVLVTGIPDGTNSGGLFQTLGTDWSAAFTTLTSNDAAFAQCRMQVITDVIAGASGPKRVRGALSKGNPSSGGNEFLDGAALTPHLPVDATVSVALITDSPPQIGWGRKSHGPLPEALTGSNGEVIDLAAWEAAALAFYVGQRAIDGGTLNYEVVIVPGTAIAALALPHAALATLVYPIKGIEVGRFLGSQGTRRIAPHSLLGH